MAFADVQFPTNISRGARGGPRRKTQIASLASGHEERNASWLASRHSYDIGFVVRKADFLSTVLAFFEARNGMLLAFRFKDWTDYKSCLQSQVLAPTDQLLGLGDGAATAFQLVKTYASGAQSYVREITKPVASTVRVSATIPTGAELIGPWDDMQSADWGNDGVTGANDAATFGPFSSAYKVGNAGAGVRRYIFNADNGCLVTAGLTYRISAWMKEGTDTGAQLIARGQPASLDSRIAGPFAAPVITAQGAGVVTNVTSTSMGSGVWLWSFDLTVGGGFDKVIPAPGNQHAGQTVILLGCSFRTPPSTGETMDFTLDALTGIVTFDEAPSEATEVRAGFEFDVPVRFDTDMIDVTLDIERLGGISSIPLLEVRE